MATKTFYATRDLKNPGYGMRMLKAGDPVELDGPKSRLYLALGAVTPTKTRQARAEPVETPTATVEQPARRKRAAAKRTTRRQK